MHKMQFFSISTLLAGALVAQAKQVVITVGGNLAPNANATGNLTATFSPQLVDADVGDVVFFNFTSGTHSATQSTFASPCVPAHSTNSTINGFDTSLRPAGNGTAITNFALTVTDLNPIYFYDSAPGACAEGAVGVVNSNESSTATLAGFIRNAERLNGTATTTSSSSSGATQTSSSSSSQTSTAGNTSGASAIRPPSTLLGIMGSIVAVVAVAGAGFLA